MVGAFLEPPCFQITRRYRRPVLRSLEQAHRPAVENHVHRATQMGPWVLINAGWYNHEMPAYGHLPADRRRAFGP